MTPSRSCRFVNGPNEADILPFSWDWNKFEQNHDAVLIASQNQNVSWLFCWFCWLTLQKRETFERHVCPISKKKNTHKNKHLAVLNPLNCNPTWSVQIFLFYTHRDLCERMHQLTSRNNVATWSKICTQTMRAIYSRRDVIHSMHT